MSLRDRRYQLALGFLAPLLILVGAYAASVWLGNDPLYCKNAPNHGGNGPGYQQPTSVSDALGKEVDCRSPSGQRDQNCQAFRQAEAAEDQACIARRQFGAGLFLGVLGAIGLFFTVLFTKDAAKGAIDAAGAANASACTAAKTLVKMDETARHELRAYLSVRPHGIVPFDPGRHTDCHIGIENVGNLPARGVRWFIDAEIDPDETRTEFPIGGLRGNNVIAPRTDIRQSHRTSFSEIEVSDFSGRGAYLYVWGKVEYDDGFGKARRYTLFCHRYDKRGYVLVKKVPPYGYAVVVEGMRYHEHGNDAD